MEKREIGDRGIRKSDGFEVTPKDDLRFRQAETWARGDSRKHKSHEVHEHRHKRLAKHFQKLSAKELASGRTGSFPCQFMLSDSCQVQGNLWLPG